MLGFLGMCSVFHVDRHPIAARVPAAVAFLVALLAAAEPLLHVETRQAQLVLSTASVAVLTALLPGVLAASLVVRSSRPRRQFTMRDYGHLVYWMAILLVLGRFINARLPQYDFFQDVPVLVLPVVGGANLLVFSAAVRHSVRPMVGRLLFPALVLTLPLVCMLSCWPLEIVTTFLTVTGLLQWSGTVWLERADEQL